MKKVLAALLLSFTFGSQSALADSAVRLVEREVKFSYHSSRNLYHCSFVERQSRMVLEALGAHDVEVSCRGGLPDHPVNWVTATFLSYEFEGQGLTPPPQGFVEVSLAFRESCDLHERIVDSLLKGFDVRELSKRSTCWHSQGRLNYSLLVLK